MIDAAELLAQARSQAGLEDFGPDDFREGLEVYCRSVSTEAGLNELGQAAVSGNIVTSLVNRLRVYDWAQRHPDVVGEEIESPLIVIGLFRAGTTLLSNLLDRDPQNRSLLRWESADSVPPPVPSEFRSGPRVDAARLGLEMLEQLNPRMAAVHHEDAAGPTECIAVMAQDFKSLSWEAISNVPSYAEWLLQTDHTSAYRYHRLVLQVLQHGGVRGRWALKSPHHAIALDSLSAVYPDAQLVLIHRDPVELCASVCSLIRTLSATFSDQDHTAYIAEHWTGLLETSIARVEAFRVAHPDHPVLDVQYRDLVSDPLGAVEAIYRGTGRVLDPVARDAMEGYLVAHPRDEFGRHDYRPEDFGLNPAQIAERFAAYVDRYQVAVGRP